MHILKYKGFSGRFEYDAATRLFRGTVLHLEDNVHFQGRSIEELKDSLAQCVNEYLSHCERTGRSPSKKFSGRFNIRISPDLHQKIAKKAEEAGLSMNSWVVELLTHSVL